MDSTKSVLGPDNPGWREWEVPLQGITMTDSCPGQLGCGRQGCWSNSGTLTLTFLYHFVSWVILVHSSLFVIENGHACNISIRLFFTAHMVMNLPAMRDTWVRHLGWEDSLEKGVPTHSSVLIWRIPQTRGAWLATVHGLAKSWTPLND